MKITILNTVYFRDDLYYIIQIYFLQNYFTIREEMLPFCV